MASYLEIILQSRILNKKELREQIEMLPVEDAEMSIRSKRKKNLVPKVTKYQATRVTRQETRGTHLTRKQETARTEVSRKSLTMSKQAEEKEVATNLNVSDEDFVLSSINDFLPLDTPEGQKGSADKADALENW